MKVVPIVYVTDMQRSLDWYRRLIPHAGLLSTSPYWSELSLGATASLALHIVGEITPGSQLGLALEADRSLEVITERLAEAGISIDREIADEAFGRSMVIHDPDGLGIQINEHDREWYPS
jgi:catechol 2,3-dioxygenase-like lactoylglutathione lyase family enzyme